MTELQAQCNTHAVSWHSITNCEWRVEDVMIHFMHLFIH